MTYCIREFQGIFPRINAASLPGNAARKAENVKLSHGRLDAWRKPKFVADLGDAQSAFVHDCCWAGSANYCKHFLAARPCNDIYISDPCACPQVVKEWCNDGEAIPLGVDKPDMPLVLSDTGIASEEFAQLRTYRVTFCGPCGEGPASLPSPPIKADKTTEVELDVPQPSGKYVVDEIKIYASHTDWDVSQGYQSINPNDINVGFHSTDGADSSWFLVGTVPVGTTVFSDGSGDVTERLCRELNTADFLPPKEGMMITGETANGSLVGFIPNEQYVYMSERNAHWGWPRRKTKIFDCRVRWVCAVGNTVLVLTDGNIYVFNDDSDGTVDGGNATRVTKIPGAYPLVSTRSVVCTRSSAIFASNCGLIEVGADGGVSIISSPFFADDDWWEIDPGSIRAATNKGRYFFTSSRFSGILDLNIDGMSTDTQRNLTTLCYFPICWIEDKQGRLFFLSDGKVYQWDAGAELLPYTYESAITRLPKPVTFSAASVLYSNLKPGQCAAPETFRIESECEELECLVLNSSEQFRVNVQRVRDLAVGVSGTRSVEEICVATDFPTLGVVAA